MTNPFKPRDDRPRQGRWQFGMATLFFLAIPVGLLAGAWSILTRSKPGEPQFWLGFALVAAAPMALGFLVSMYLKLRR
ncbi:MAG: hypothetical protein ACYC6Y_00190 [Thermoguttaceae bacterium]